MKTKAPQASRGGVWGAGGLMRGLAAIQTTIEVLRGEHRELLKWNTGRAAAANDFRSIPQQIKMLKSALVLSSRQH